MTKNLFKRRKENVIFFICIMVFNFISTPLTAHGAGNTQAVTIRMEKIVGSGTSVSNMAGKKLSARSKMKLYSGYKVATARSNYVYMSLDSKKAVKEDQNSKVQIKKQGSKNELYVMSGKLFFNVSKKLKANETMNVKTSNASMGIRGTSGVVSVTPVFNEKAAVKGMRYVIQIFDGTGYVEYEDKGVHNTTLKGGYQLVISQEENEKPDIYKEKITLDSVPFFVLEEVLGDESLLNRILKETDFTEEDIKEAFEENKETEEEETENLEDSLEQVKDIIAKNETIIYEEEETNSSLNSGNNFSSNEGNETAPPAENSLNTDNLPGGSLTQADLEKAFAKNSTVRLTTSENQKVIQLSGETTIPSGKNLIVDEKITLKNPEDTVLRNDGTLTNNGIHSIHNSGIIENNGKIENNGAIYNEEHSVLRSSGIIQNAGELDNKGQLELEGGTLINSGIVGNKDGASLYADSSVKYENTGSLRIFSSVDTDGDIEDIWEKWRTVRFMDTDGTTVLKDAYAPLGQIPEPPAGIEERENFTGWSERYDGLENVQVSATAGKQLQLECMGMKIGCDSFHNIDSLVDRDSSVNIVLMRDYNMNGEPSDEKLVHFSNNNSQTIDLNGFTLSVTDGCILYNDSNLTIKNSGAAGGISASENGYVGGFAGFGFLFDLFIGAEGDSPSGTATSTPTPTPTMIEPPAAPGPGVIVNEGENLVLENVKITVNNVGAEAVINNQGTFFSMRNCELEMNGTGTDAGIKNQTGKIELADTTLKINIPYSIGIDLGRNSPEGALKASNSRLIGTSEYISGVKGQGNRNIIVNWEDVMTFELANETCIKIAWEDAIER